MQAGKINWADETEKADDTTGDRKEAAAPAAPPAVPEALATEAPGAPAVAPAPAENGQTAAAAPPAGRGGEGEGNNHRHPFAEDTLNFLTRIQPMYRQL